MSNRAGRSITTTAATLLLVLVVTGLASREAFASQDRSDADIILLKSEALASSLDQVNLGQLVLGEGFKERLATVISSDSTPAFLQPSLKKIQDEIPYIISNYYDCGGETQPFFDALNSVLESPLIQPFLNAPDMLQAQFEDSTLLLASLPALYSHVVSDNPPMYNWLVNLPLQCMMAKGYIQPAAVKLAEGTGDANVLIAEQLPKLVDDFYDTGCTTEQMLAFFPVILEAQSLPSSQQTNVFFNKQGFTPDGESVGLTSPFTGGPSILQCITPNLAVLTYLG